MPLSTHRPWVTLLLVLVFLTASPAWGAELLGRVVGLADGDTLTLLTAERRQVRVRLGEIDTPESRQPYGTRAQQVLSGLVFGKDVRIVVQDTDRYGRTVGRVYTGPQDVNAEMVRQGAAWVYRQYSHDAGLLRVEAEAKAARRGLWALPEAERTAPWEWRAAARNGGGWHRCKSADRTGPLLTHGQHRFYLRCQAVLPGDGQLRRGALLPPTMWAIAAGWGPGWVALQKPLQVSAAA